MAKALITKAPLYNGRRMAVVASKASLMRAGQRGTALGFRAAQNLAFPPLDMNVHSSASNGGWHYSIDGYGAIDWNWIHEGANTPVETMLIDTYLIPILLEEGLKGILHKPRHRKDHQSWCHVDLGEYHDWTRRKWSAAQLAYGAKLIDRHRNGNAVQRPAVVSGQVLVVVDGLFGPATIRQLQRALKVPVDGSFGPQTIKAVQRWLNRIHPAWKLAVDGLYGPETIKALQRHYGNQDPDGIVSKPSIMVSALQRDLNRKGITP